MVLRGMKPRKFQLIFIGLLGITNILPAQSTVPYMGRRSRSTSDVTQFISKMLQFDKDGDGCLAASEMTDERLLPLFNRADLNSDAVVTRDELRIFFEKESPSRRAGPLGPGTSGDPAGPNGPSGPGSGPGSGSGGPGSLKSSSAPVVQEAATTDSVESFNPSRLDSTGRPGEILAPAVRSRLNLSPSQIDELNELQKEVDQRLQKLLSNEQQRQLRRIPANVESRPPEKPTVQQKPENRPAPNVAPQSRGTAPGDKRPPRG